MTVWEVEPKSTTRPVSRAWVPMAAVGSTRVWEAYDRPPVPEPSAQDAGMADIAPSDSGTPPKPETIQQLPIAYAPPNLSGGVPSAYVANWGDYYILASAGTAGKQRDGQPDGSVGAGFGLGDAERAIALELNWGIGSVRNFNANGRFSAFASRMLVNQPRLQVLVGGGVFDLVTYGNEEPQPDPTGFGVVTMALPLRQPNFEFNQVLQLSFGVGGQLFAALDNSFEGDDYAPFGALGIELAPNLGISAGISGRGTNFNVSYTPFRELPISINLLAADVFDQSPFGTVGVLTVSWGDNFRTGLF